MDWNNDGHLDILSGCYWTDDAKAGHIYMLAGKGTLDFAAAEAVKNAEGEPLENAKLAEDDQENQTKTICTHQHAVDYDGDGDLDMVVGCFGPQFFYYENTGSNSSPALSAPIQLPVESPSYHSAPHLVDWDADGDLDLLSGTGSGGAVISINEGTRQKPEWSAFQELIPTATVRTQSTSQGKTIQPSASTRVWATDWNRDGHLDLLVGDSAHVVNPKEGLSAEEFAAKQKEYDEKMAALIKERNELDQKRQSSEVEESDDEKDEGKDSEQSKDFNTALQEWSEKFSELHASRREFMDEQRTGFVWLYIRKAPADDSPKLTGN